MTEWPTVLLPLPSIEPFEGSFMGNVERSGGEAFVDQRRVYNSDYEVYTAAFRFSNFQYAVFLSFLHYKLAGGSITFTMELPNEDGLTEEQEVRIVDGLFRADFMEGQWNVSVALEIMREVPVDV
jgi:hypothetical protein